MSILKLGSAEINATMLKAATALRSQQTEIARLTAALESNERNLHAEKIASTAVERGIMDPEEATEYARELAGGNKDLDMVADFVNRASGGVPLVAGLQKEASVGNSEVDVLTSYLLSNDVP